MPGDFRLFLSEMLRHPREVVAVAPSSGAVARRMTEGLGQVRGPVVEIGPGTGSFTRAILACGVAPERLTLLETNATFCAALRARFPGVRVLNRRAQEIAGIGLRDDRRGDFRRAGAGAPDHSARGGGPGLRGDGTDGVFTQITYSPQAPISPEMQRALGIHAQRRGTVWVNLPPARVFVFRRIQH